MVVAAAIGYVLGHVGTHVAFSRAGVLVVLVTVCAGGIGFVDDWTKVRHQRSIGLTKRAKFAALVIMSVGFALAAEHWVGVNTHLSYTRWDSVGIDLGSVGWIFWAVFVIVGTANAVNLTDGLDGLAEPLDALGRNPGGLDPDLLRLVVGLVHRRPEPVGVDPHHLGDELPGKRYGTGFEVIAEAEVPEHLEERAMPPRLADDLDVDGAEALWTEVALIQGAGSSPRKYGLKGTMPAIVKSTVGS